MRRDRIFRRVLAEGGYDADLGGVHSAYVKVESWWLSVYGNRELTPEETNEAYRDLDAKVFLSLYPSESEGAADRVSRTAREKWPQFEKDVPLELYPDAEPLLRKLKGDGLELALVSNAPADTAKVVEPLGLSKYMDNVVISGVVGYSKPHPMIFKIALERAGVRAEETVHVGDLYESDVVGARNAGIRGVLLDRDGTLSHHDCPRIASLDELPRLL